MWRAATLKKINQITNRLVFPRFSFASPVRPPADVTPVHPDCNSFVMTQRQDVFEDLRQALRIMNIINDQTPIPNMLYAMWLLENKQLRQGTNINVSCMCVCISIFTNAFIMCEFFLYPLRIVVILLSSPKYYNKRFNRKSISIG